MMEDQICVHSFPTDFRNELFAYAFFLCMSQEGHTVTWPVVEAMTEPKESPRNNLGKMAAVQL